MKFELIASTALIFSWDAATAFNIHRRITSSVLVPTWKSKKPIHWQILQNSFKRSMVAMEPERASIGNNEKDLNELKPVSSVLTPEDLGTEIKEADGFSEWQAPYTTLSNGIQSDKKIDVDINVEAFVGEVRGTRLDIDGKNLGGDEIISISKNNRKCDNYQAQEHLVNKLRAEGEVQTNSKQCTAEETLPAQEKGGMEPVVKLNFLFNILNRALSPIMGREIQKNVPKNSITGAWISGAIISMMIGLDPITSAFSASGLSYISITPGSVGDIVRAVGEATWDAGLIALKVTTKFSAAFGLGPNTNRVAIVDPSADIVSKESIAVGEDIAKLVEEVEDTVLEVESILERANNARDSIALEEAQAAEAERLAEEARLAEIEYLMEEARIEKEAKEAEEEFIAEEARYAEEERLAHIAANITEETTLSKEGDSDLISDEEWGIEKEAKEAEEELIAEEARYAEEERLANIAANITEETTLSKEGDSDLISDEEWEASIQLAEGLSADATGEKNEWDAARQLAKDLVDEPENDSFDFNAPNLTDEERMELIGQAARAAVEQFEAERQHVNNLGNILEENRRNEVKSILEQEGAIDVTRTKLGSHDNAERKKEEKSYQKMTVVVLKDILRSRGLKVSGRKADLILRLEEDDE